MKRLRILAPLLILVLTCRWALAFQTLQTGPTVVKGPTIQTFTSGVTTPTFDAVFNASPIASGTTITWNHTLGAGSHPAIFVVGMGDAAAPNSCTYAGNSMGAAIFTKQDSNPVARMAAFIISGQASGVSSISCTYLSAVGIGAAASQSWLGVNQASPNRTCQTANDGGVSSTTITVTVGNAVSGDVVVDGAFDWRGAVGATLTSNQTSRYIANGIFGGSFSFGTSSASAAGSTVMSYTSPVSSFWAIGGCALVGG